MSDALYRSFLEATREVFILMLDLDRLTEEPVNPDADGTKPTIRIAIGVTGDLAGKITYVFPRDTMLQIVKIMSGGMEFPEVDDFVTSAIGEIANIISGKVMIQLSEQNIVCDILPPQIINNIEKEVLPSSERNTVGIHTDIGDLALDIRLEAGKK